MTKEDDEIAAYQARLKKTSFRLSSISPKLVLALAMPVILIATCIITYRMDHPDEAAQASPSAVPPRPPTEGEVAAKALQKVADDYAPLDPATLEAGDIALARGRKVAFVEQSMDLDPEAARLLGSNTRMTRRLVTLPDGFVAANAGPFATKPEETGVVVLLRVRMLQAGAYSGGGEPAYDLDYSGEAILVPERKHVAKIHHHVSAPPTATRLSGGILVGAFAHDDGAWMRDAAVALNAGHAPAL